VALTPPLLLLSPHLVPLGSGPARAAMATQPVIMLLSCTTKKLHAEQPRNDGRQTGW
jgi:hypothetical protein